MGTFGFSYIGLLYLSMLIIPNLIWSKNQPVGYTSENENKILGLFEKTGQIAVSVLILIFSNFNLQPISLWSFWLVASFIFMFLYEYWWSRYFKSRKTLKDFHSSLLGIPVAGASLPVISFFLLAIYGKVLIFGIAVIIFGIGHIGIHLQHLKELSNN